MIFLTKNEIELVDRALSDLGVYPPWDLPAEKLPLYLLLGLCGKVANTDKRLVEVEKRTSTIEGCSNE